MIYEEPLAHDPEAVCHLFRAFNRWLVEDWTFNYGDRIFAAPYVTLADPAWAAESWPGPSTRVPAPWSCGRPPHHRPGRRNPFDPMFDGFWGLANESGITVVVHAADSGISSNGYAVDGFGATFSGGWKPSIKSFAIEQAIRDYLLTADLREPFRAVPQPAHRLHRERGRVPARGHQEDPVDGQQDAGLLEARPGRDAPAPRVDQSVLGGRRLPGGRVHGRRPGPVRLGLAPHRGPARAPDYVTELKNFSAEDRRLILNDNVQELITLRPT